MINHSAGRYHDSEEIRITSALMMNDNSIDFNLKL